MYRKLLLGGVVFIFSIKKTNGNYHKKGFLFLKGAYTASVLALLDYLDEGSGILVSLVYNFLIFQSSQ